MALQNAGPGTILSHLRQRKVQHRHSWTRGGLLAELVQPETAPKLGPSAFQLQRVKTTRARVPTKEIAQARDTGQPKQSAFQIRCPGIHPRMAIQPLGIRV
jgi:hypothetical protein